MPFHPTKGKADLNWLCKSCLQKLPHEPPSPAGAARTARAPQLPPWRIRERQACCHLPILQICYICVQCPSITVAVAAPARVLTCRRLVAVGACPSTAAPRITAAALEPLKLRIALLTGPAVQGGQPHGAEWGRWRWCGQGKDSLGPMHRLDMCMTSLALSLKHHKPLRTARQQPEAAAVHGVLRHPRGWPASSSPERLHQGYIAFIAALLACISCQPQAEATARLLR
jgi:hypothetical protein